MNAYFLLAPGLMVAVIVGLTLGLFFFGGLWWSLLRGAASPRPALWFGASLLLRTAVVLPGFYWVGAAQWPRLLACLIGFYAARLSVLRATRPPVAGARHAS